ncbi:IclR family transcriptional regulator [Nitratireductor aquimarinus]|uniref:IclR family transcriptional regulator n=1 Tax=Nitratireductor aquimarinus TaxID=889300 RepID=UPI001A8CB1EC|nr:IclR family transcriptional regulator [Nitratireductor aquimarinus]MBN8245758.1 IclR family transcriptional regulator [Nitratireductor aquimarinus]MBY6134140.1 IclR family transcriptional regulator [Nitratireductor aquimarinus]MCA1305228.1 IclR family transcriptional regulator [Nitratireductor aquimarinus]
MSALEDAIAILGCFTYEEPALTQAELTRRVGRPKATVSRVMKVLRETEVLEFDPESRLYRPGIKLFELGQISRSHQNFLDLVQKHLQHVCAVGGHTGYITVFDGYQISVLRMIRGSSPVAIATAPGYRAWPHATSNGRAMLALLQGEEWRQRVPDSLPFVSKQTPNDHEELAEWIRKIRETGRSYSTNGSYEGVSSQGIAIQNPDTAEVIGVAVSYPSALATPDMEEGIGSLLDEMKIQILRYVKTEAN